MGNQKKNYLVVMFHTLDKDDLRGMHGASEVSNGPVTGPKFSVRQLVPATRNCALEGEYTNLIEKYESYREIVEEVIKCKRNCSGTCLQEVLVVRIL